MAAPKINSAIGGKELIEKVNQIIDNTQDKLPNASTSGKVLKSTNTTGGVEWGDVEIDTTWGNITGTLSNQTDLNTVLNNKLSTSLKGTNNGLAELDSNGKVPSSQLPAFVDDVLEYESIEDFPATGESGKIYIAKDTNKTYRWSGTQYVEISASLALGETSSTAYRGDRGAIAYTHAVTNKGTALSSGLYKVTTNSEGHITAGTAVIKSDITELGIPAQDTVTTATTTGSGNAVTSISASNGALTITKGTTFLTSHQDISGKQNTITGGATTITSSNLTANRALISDSNGKVAVSAVTSTELEYLDGVTSAIQTQINNKATTTSSNFVASEKVYNQGSTAAITLTNGRIFYCTGSSITLPSVVNGVCITCIVTASSVFWGGNIRWKGNKAPTLTANVDLVSFLGYNNSWYGG